MEKLYLIESNVQSLIDEEITKITKDISDFELVKYDLETSTIDDLIEALDTYNLFAPMKVVVGINPLFLIEKQTEFNFLKFEKYLENPSNNILILVTPKMNNVLKVTKLVSKYFKIIKLDNTNLESFVKNNLEDYQMDNRTIIYFLSKTSKDLNNILAELNKLKMYKLDDKVILTKDIDLVTRQTIENTIYDLIDAIIKKDKKKSYMLYKYFIESGTVIFQILVILSNQIRLIYNVKVLHNLSDLKISKILDAHEYSVKLARGKGINYSKEELLSLLYKLAVLDQDIKSGKQLPSICFLTFIMEM